jgi:nucleotide-binding universal stress UspA family protein
MYKLFNNILVPVTSQYPAVAVEKAVHLSNQFNCDVHLLNVTGRQFWQSSCKAAEKKMQLNELKEKYAHALPRGSFMHTGVGEDNLENALASYVALHSIDLILAHPKRSRFNVFDVGVNVNKLAARTGCPVLSLQAGPPSERIRNIVLPVGSHLPLRKLMLAIYMAKDANAAIHLISLSGNNAAAEAKSHVYLEKTYQVLRQNTSLPIKCKTMIGENIADTTLEYAKHVEADLILVNPGPESLLSGPMNRMFSKFLFNRSNIPVLTVV